MSGGGPGGADTRMTCHSAELENGTTLHICFSDYQKRPVANRRRRRFWCFKCRKRLLHTLMLFDPGPESYYDPHVSWECPKCHEEHILFPGWEWAE